MSDYSQHGEQQTILEWAAGYPEPGGFIDLGCYDGISYSNTAALAELGWPGICLDAAPDAAADCAINWSERDDIVVVLAAFDHRGGNDPAVIHWKPGTMYTSMEPGRRPDAAEATILIPRIDLDWLAGQAAALPRPLFLSVDLEGGSIEAAIWAKDHIDPDCIIVEAYNPPQQDQVKAAFRDWRQLARNPWNMIYAKTLVAA